MKKLDTKRVRSRLHRKSSTRGETILRRTRILVADDHQPTLDVVESLLQAKLDVIGKVGDGLSLLEAAGRLRPDLVVLDISMPEMNGIEVAKRLRETGVGVKIVFVTVHEDADLAREALEAGGSAYVVKSCMASELLTAVKEALANRSFISPSRLFNSS